MTTKPNATSNVNLDKALAEIRQYPGARTDRKVFTAIASHANSEGVAEISASFIAGVIGTSVSATISSMRRLDRKGFVRVKTEKVEDTYFYTRIHTTCTISRRYMRSASDDASRDSADIAASVQRVTTAYIRVLAAVAEAYAKKYDDLAEQLDDIAANIRKATGNN